MERKTYGKNTLGALLNFDWSGLGNWYELRDDGIRWKAPTGVLSPSEREFRMKHPTCDLDKPALAFPFTVDEFIAFCDVHPTFAWEYIDGLYSNDDDLLDEVALAELARESPSSAELARAWLTRTGGASPDGARPRAGVPAHRAQEDAILAKLRELGHEPLKLQPAGPGMKSPAKQSVRDALGYSDEVFRKAWKRLSRDSRIESS